MGHESHHRPSQSEARPGRRVGQQARDPGRPVPEDSSAPRSRFRRPVDVESGHGRIPRKARVDRGRRSPADRLPAVVNLNETRRRVEARIRPRGRARGMDLLATLPSLVEEFGEHIAVSASSGGSSWVQGGAAQPLGAGAAVSRGPRAPRAEAAGGSATGRSPSRPDPRGTPVATPGRSLFTPDTNTRPRTRSNAHTADAEGAAGARNAAATSPPSPLAFVEFSAMTRLPAGVRPGPKRGSGCPCHRGAGTVSPAVTDRFAEA
jgi:hypothetical protein